MSRIAPFALAALLGVALAATTDARDLIIPPSASDAILATTGDDFSVGPRNLGFTFPYFGTNQTQAFVNSNGNLTFGGGNTSFSSTPFPFSGSPMIAPGWDDNILPPGQIRENTTIPGTYVAIWNGVGNFDGTGTVTMEAILFGAGNPYGLAPGSVVLSYGDSTGIDTTWNSTITVGLNQGNGTGFASLFPLGIGASNATLTEPQFLGLNNRSFLFTPNGQGGYNVSEISSLTVVPEPATMAVFGFGALAAGLATRRRRTAAV